MAAEAIFFTIMIVVFVTCAVVMYFIERINRTNNGNS